ncbi:MAG: pseudaminic acid cytidylyltransferase [Bacteroidales bacterium]|nr:pseudaminic acid cytidylyltransferase [Bacteroidales bacterium]MCF8456466.1 pseudaminic acid cytidylyltransferase [Bacteroidales bacterium]
MANIAIIPARGGSKRIPGKNIKDFLGKPVIVYSIEIAIESGLFDEIMVSTDDHQIAKVAREAGANVPVMRSGKNADDHATLADVVLEVVEYYKKEGKVFDKICCILPTAPLIKIVRLMQGHEMLNEEDYTSVVPVVPFSFPILRSFKINEKNILEANWPEYFTKRSQDLPPSYHDSGSFYWVEYNSFVNEKSLLTQKSTALILDEIEVQDIDSETDWKLTELKYKLNHGQA